MSVLGYEKMLELKNEIFFDNSYLDENFKGASYELRVSTKDLVLDGVHHIEFKGSEICIPPHQITFLSTVESVVMPRYLMGKIALRFKYSSKGLTILGGHVDPMFRGHLILIVTNLSDEMITIFPLSAIAIISFFLVDRAPGSPETDVIDEGFKQELSSIPDWIVDEWRGRNQVDTTKLIKEQNMKMLTVQKQVDKINTTTQVVVTGGISLIAVTILSVVLQVVFATWNSSINLVNNLLISNEYIYPFSPLAVLFIPVLVVILFMIFIVVSLSVVKGKTEKQNNN